MEKPKKREHASWCTAEPDQAHCNCGARDYNDAVADYESYLASVSGLPKKKGERGSSISEMYFDRGWNDLASALLAKKETRIQELLDKNDKSGYEWALIVSMLRARVSHLEDGLRNIVKYYWSSANEMMTDGTNWIEPDRIIDIAKKYLGDTNGK